MDISEIDKRLTRIEQLVEELLSQREEAEEEEEETDTSEGSSSVTVNVNPPKKRKKRGPYSVKTIMQFYDSGGMDAAKLWATQHHRSFERVEGIIKGELGKRELDAILAKNKNPMGTTTKTNLPNQ
jgi:hypothetical protein